MPHKDHFYLSQISARIQIFSKKSTLSVTAVHRHETPVFKLPHFSENGHKIASVCLPLYIFFLVISEWLQLVINIQAPCKCPTNSLC